MKKVYLSCLTVCFSLVSMAQFQKHSLKLQKDNNPVIPYNHQNNSGVEDKVILWSDDFANQSEWNSYNSAGNNDDWVVGTTIPSGAFPIPVIISTTAANGFGLFDSDLLCSTDQSAYLEYATPINMSGNSTVVMEFQQMYRRFTNGQTFVEVSTNGSSWTTFEVNSAYASNQTSANPETVTLDISSVAANQSTVHIRFWYESDVNNGGDGCDYAWMVDDVQFTGNALSANDLAILKSFSNNVQTSTDYSIVADSQRVPLEVGASIQNLGTTDLTNKTLSITINDGATNVYTGSVVFSILTAETKYVWKTTNFTPLNNKDYTISFSLPSDDVVGNNNGSTTLKTRDFNYAHDFTSTDKVGYNIDDEVGVGEIFQIFNNTTLYSVDVEFEAGTTPSSQVSVNVYDAADITTVIGQGIYNVPNSAIGNGSLSNIPLQVPVSLSAGSFYVIEVRKQQNTNRLYVGSSPEGNGEDATVIYGPFGAGGAVGFYVGWTYAVAVRMNFSLGCADFMSVPTPVDAQTCNPNSGSINLTSSGSIALNNQYTYSWTGAETGTSGAGQGANYSINSLIAGTYAVTVTNNGCSITVPGIVIGSVTSASVSVNQTTPVSCYGMNDGAISYSVTGDGSNYVFTWNTGATGTTLSGIGAGVYTITGTDGNCTTTSSFTLTEPAEIVLNMVPTNVSTCGGTNGSVSVTIPGGVGFNYSYNWTGTSNGNAGPLGNTYTITSLSAGNYIVTVLNNGCGNTATVSVSENGAPVINIIEFASISCPGDNDGSLKVTSSVSISSYTFTWSNGASGIQANNLMAGTYFVSGTNGTCTTTQSFVLDDPASIDISGSVGIGSVNTTVNGGTGNLTYQWSGPNGFTSSSADISNVSNVGAYSVLVTDGNGCTATQTFNVAFVGIEDLTKGEEKTIKIYPNPATDVINFELTDEVKYLVLSDLSGKVIKSVEVTELKSYLNVDNCSNGIYFIDLLDRSGKLISNSKISIAK